MYTFLFAKGGDTHKKKKINNASTFTFTFVNKICNVNARTNGLQPLRHQWYPIFSYLNHLRPCRALYNESTWPGEPSRLD